MKTRATLLLAVSTVSMLIAGAMPAYAQDASSPSADAAPGARQAGRGTLSGQVFDPAAGSYLRDAIVDVEAADGQKRTVTTGEAGAFRVPNLPAGTARVTVSFVGYVAQTRDIAIQPDETATLELELVRSGRDGQAAGEGDIVVSGIRDASAIELMSQRKELQIADMLNTEAYGDIAGGNPAEFMKYMPGVDVDGSNGTSVYAYLRGLPAEFTRTQLNGMDVVSANAATATGYSSAAAAARIFNYETLSMSAIDAVTTYKTTGADQNADAPAGIIDLRTKRAYDRKKGLFVVSLEGFTHENMWDSYKNVGPDTGGWGNRKFLPNASLFYSNSFLNQRLGVMFSLGLNDQYIEREQITINRNYRQSATAPYPLEFYSMQGQTGARRTIRRTGALVLDFKATDTLNLSVMGTAYRGNIQLHNQITTVSADTSTGTNGLLNLNGQPATSADALSGFVGKLPATTTSITSAANDQYKYNNGKILAANFDWKLGGLSLDGYFAYSDSHSYYDSPSAGQVQAGPTYGSTGNAQFVKGSSDLALTDWTITQISGPDWSNPASYTFSGKPAITVSNGIYARISARSGALNARYDAEFGDVPVSFKAGFKITDTSYLFGNDAQYGYTYNGPLTNAEFIAQATNPGISGITDKSHFVINSLSGSSYIPAIDLARLLQMYRDNPGEWTSAATPAQYATANYRRTDVDETIKAIYGMATADVTPKLQLRAGVRGEWTSTRADVFQSRPLAEVRAYTPPGAAAACVVTGSTGIATTIPCIDYQFANGASQVKGEYFTLFPSASAKYTFGRRTDLQIGYSRTILRPGVDATGSSPIESLTGSSTGGPLLTVPNPGLTPAFSDNFSARFSHYLRGVGMVNLGLYYNRIDGLVVVNEYTAAEAASNPVLAPYASDPTYANYAFATYTQRDIITIKGLEAAFQHSFTWLPAPFDGLSVRGAFMHNEPNQKIPRVGNNIGSLGVIYEKGPVRLFANLLWNDDKYRSDTPTWFQARTDLTVSGRLRITKHLETYFTVNNLLAAPYNVMVPGSSNASTAAANIGSHSAIYVQNGRTGTFGFRARF
ncbi:TonB-dependent receptor [Sphingomonas sp.]|uniref:TonB-dependent receptor n=1 Tax=Sphingomonas sp. TaxID=28214 RepID=UPI002B5868B2|nr:TonB-dependent receptor [Sphingomonas sp.]HWK34816.1 TonB-dependent receptor [Sphingomonas sp.]